MPIKEIIAFFTLGLLGGFGHCMGMCHPFVLYVSGRYVQNKKGYKELFVPHLKYNFGRIITYSLLGLLAGIAGTLAGLRSDFKYIHQAILITAGLILVLHAFFALLGYNIFNKFESKIVKGKWKDFFKKSQPKSPLLTGIVLGLLPCGFLYNALIGSVTFNNAYFSMLAMMLFGIGTMVGLLLLSVLGNYIMKARNVFNVLSLLLLMVMGSMFIYKAIIL